MEFKKTIRDIDLQGKILLLRVDYNVPFDSSTGKISDDSRIQATLPTIKYLLDRNVKIILISHRGRPRGYDPSLY
jgi:phosphoglycerate kinase